MNSTERIQVTDEVRTLKDLKCLAIILSDLSTVQELLLAVDDMKKALSTLPPDQNLSTVLKCENLSDLRRSAEQPDYSVLPPRIIINHIFPFLSLDINDFFGCFGRFKKDQTRHVWKMFTSLNLSGHFKPLVVDWASLEYLKIENFFGIDQIPETIIMRKLKKLHFYFCEEYVDSFFVGKEFHNLQSLIFYKCGRVTGNVITLSHPEKVKRIVVALCWKFQDEFFRHNNFSSLESLKLKQCKEIEGSHWCPLPKLEFLSIDTCNSFNDDLFVRNSFPSLYSLVIITCQEIKGEKWKINGIASLERLQISSCVALKGGMFQVNYFSSLKHLKLENTEIGECKFWNDLSSLEIAEFIFSGINDYVFQHQNFKNLKFLRVNDDFLEGKDWKEMNSLEILHVMSLSMKNSLMQKNKFKNLKRVSLQVCSKLDGAEWSENPKLTSFSASFQRFTDDFFRTFNLEHVEIINFESCFKICGKNWRKMKVLKVMKLVKCHSMLDDLFQNQTFYFLTDLLIDKNSNITGKNWRNIPQLQSFEISKCPKFEDTYFQQVKSFRSLKNLKLNSLTRVRGKQWKIEWNKLEVLHIVKCNFFVDEIFQYFHLQELRRLNLESNSSIHGINWLEIPVLESLTIKNQHFCNDFFVQYRFLNLKELFLSHVKETTINWQSFKEEKKVLSLEKRLKMIEDVVKKHERYMKHLKVVGIRDCEFGDVIKSQISKVESKHQTTY